jgi:acyl-CoA hydrolase
VTVPTTAITRLVFPDQGNHRGTLFGGEALGMLASAGSIAATRRARKPVVLAHSGSIDFVAPVQLGAIVETHATVTRIGRSSLSVEVTLDAEDLLSGERHRACQGELVFVAVDTGGSPTAITVRAAHRC